MGRLTAGQAQFFYAFHLDEVVPADHVVRRIDAVLDVGWIHQELAPFYSNTGRPSIDPELMIRMLLVGYVFAIRSERRMTTKVSRSHRPPSRQTLSAGEQRELKRRARTVVAGSPEPSFVIFND